MGIITYAFFTFALTAAISLAVTGIIVLVSKLTSKSTGEEETE